MCIPEAERRIIKLELGEEEVLFLRYLADKCDVSHRGLAITVGDDLVEAMAHARMIPDPHMKKSRKHKETVNVVAREELQRITRMFYLAWRDGEIDKEPHEGG